MAQHLCRVKVSEGLSLTLPYGVIAAKRLLRKCPGFSSWHVSSRCFPSSCGREVVASLKPSSPARGWMTANQHCE